MDNQEKRIALVIGNSDYGVGNEVSGVKNACSMKECLEALGFQVLPPVFDGTLKMMTDALKSFVDQIGDATVVVFFYSGHGVQLENRNYLIPTDGSVSAARSLLLDEVLQALANAPNEALKFVFVDACRNIVDLPTDAPQGMTNPSEAPTGTLQAFAASPNQFAESGLPTQNSVYTKALLEYLPVPGLDMVSLFDQVRADVFRSSDTGQQTFEAGAIPKDFFFRPPVFVQAKTYGWPNSPVLVILNGEIVISTDVESVTPLQLNAKENHLAVLVSHGRSRVNDQIWGPAAGWGYRFDLEVPGIGKVEFEDSEKVPFLNGPHHGKVFTVAKAALFVDPKTAEVTVTEKKADLAKQEGPIWARDQEILFQAKLLDLDIPADAVLGASVNNSLARLFRPLIASLLKTGKILGQTVVERDKAFVVVRGNKALRDIAQKCMTDGWPDRLRDLSASFTAFFNRHPKPFDPFADGLNACIRAHGEGQVEGFTPEDLRVAVTLDNLTPEAPADEVGEAGTPVPEAPAPAVLQPISDAGLSAIAQDAILHPRTDEALVDTRSIEQVIQGVPVKAEVYTFLTFNPVDDKLQVLGRVVADLSDLQNKIGPLVDTIPLPTDNCSHFGVDNVVARIWGKQVTIDGNVATLKLNGNVDIWTCLKNPVPCSKIEWEERNVLGARIRIPRTVFFDCNPPIKNRNLSQPFDAALPFRVEVVEAKTYALRLGTPSVDLGGALGGVTEGILKIAGVDVNAKVKELLDQAINPDLLKQTLPEFLLPYDPNLTRAELLSNSGALALTLEMETTLSIDQVAELLTILSSQF
jgi:hypothetical protein